MNPVKVIHMKGSFKALNMELSQHPEQFLYMAYKETLESLQEKWTEKGYTPMEDLEVTITISVPVSEQ